MDSWTQVVLYFIAHRKKFLWKAIDPDRDNTTFDF